MSTRQIALLLGVHAHQPVGNFDAVIEDAHLRCYQPFLELLERFPQFPFSLHISGWLLARLQNRFPQDMQRLRRMVLRGQAELFTAGYTEPVLAAIPVRDRIGQVNLMSERLSQGFGSRPEGAWLTERVWDSAVVPSLVACGVKYVTVDDYHFLCAGKSATELYGYFSTEEDGRRLDIYPISEALRYRIPFAPVAEVVGFLEEQARADTLAAAVYFDDIEKFGIWPQTYDWVYTRGWLEQFIQAVLASPVVRPMHYGEHHRVTLTRGVVYLPTTSYVEMNEWTLPHEQARQYAERVQLAREDGTYDAQKAFLRGGIWRNFLSRYPEANAMHKRMVGLSNRFNQLPETRRSGPMRDALYEAQSNDAYWHGLFGGLYLPHLRRAIYRALIQLELLLDEVQERPARIVQDFDLDGVDEIFLHNESLQAVLRQGQDADLVELDSYLLLHNFGDTLTRQTEHYHHKVLVAAEAAVPGSNGTGIANPHQQMGAKHLITDADLVVDYRRRGSFNDCWHDCAGINHVPSYHCEENPATSDRVEFSAKLDSIPGWRVRKQYWLESGSLVVQYRLDEAGSGQWVVELNLAMPSCDGPAGCLWADGTVLGGFGQEQSRDLISQLVLRDEVLGGSLDLEVSPPCALSTQPLFSVSQSEAGFEKIMQAITLTLTWDLAQLKSHPSIKLRLTPVGVPGCNPVQEG